MLENYAKRLPKVENGNITHDLTPPGTAGILPAFPHSLTHFKSGPQSGADMEITRNPM